MCGVKLNLYQSLEIDVTCLSWCSHFPAAPASFLRTLKMDVWTTSHLMWLFCTHQFGFVESFQLPLQHSAEELYFPDIRRQAQFLREHRRIEIVESYTCVVGISICPSIADKLDDITSFFGGRQRPEFASFYRSPPNAIFCWPTFRTSFFAVPHFFVLIHCSSYCLLLSFVVVSGTRHQRHALIQVQDEKLKSMRGTLLVALTNSQKLSKSPFHLARIQSLLILPVKGRMICSLVF